PTPQGYRVGREDAARALELHGDLGFPCVVKPACGGSSVGLALVREPEALAPAVAQACRFGGEALVERFVSGREVTVGILGDKVLGSLEVATPREGFDYEAKYKGGASYFVPPRLSPTRVANVEALALGAYRALGCRGQARVDLLCSDTENDVVLEVNTLPGFTPTSLLPKIAAHAGLDFPELVERVLALATRDEAGVTEAPAVAPISAPEPRRAVS
ncbi:ATP-grasp domain-containing protein, partial [Pyxidicoccus sp. 3LG]